MHVMGNRPHVVEELAIYRPPLILLPYFGADKPFAVELNGVLQGERLSAVENYVTQALVGRRARVGGRGSRGEPAFVNAAAIGAERVQILGRQFEASTGHQKRARHPGWGQTQDAGARGNRLPNERGACLFRCYGPWLCPRCSELSAGSLSFSSTS